MLLGRGPECARLDALLTQVRAGTSAALVVTGEPGVGKTRLLEYAADRAEGLLVLRAIGLESERNLPFAGLSELTRPILGYLDALPGPQRAALAGALAIGPPLPADRFGVCAATLSLLCEAAARQPVLAIVDDAHWLDAASAQALEFTARRLGGEAIGMILATRLGALPVPDSPGWLDATRLDTMAVTGLDDGAARKLLVGTGASIAPAVADRLVSELGGNPLALLEMPGALSGAQLAGLAALPEPLPVTTAIRRAFARRLDAVSAPTRRLLVLAACDATADLATLYRASAVLGLDLADLPQAELAGLVRIGEGRIAFTHPLLRSTAYHTAGPGERRAAHRALAAGVAGSLDPVRQAWHLAAAAIEPDENVAVSLQCAGDAARARNAFIPASRAYQRAAELTADPDRQLVRWMAAGEAACLGGDLPSGALLLDRVIELAADPVIKADAQVMLAYATLWTAPPIEKYQRLIMDAEAVLPFDKQRSAILMSLASSFCVMMGRLDLALETATRAFDLGRGVGGMAVLASGVSLAHASILTGSRAAGRRLTDATLAHPGIGGSDLSLQAVRMICGQALVWCERYDAAERLLGSSVTAGRAAGRLDDLPFGLAVLSDLRFRTGEWGPAYAHAVEAVELSSDCHTNVNLSYALACTARLDAAMGAAEVCRDRLVQAVSLAGPIGVVSISAYAAAARGLLELGAADYRQAAAELARVDAHVKRYGVADPCVIQWRPDYIESLIRIGRLADARRQLAVLDAEAASTGSGWAKATAARCRGLLMQTFQAAIPQLEEAVALADSSAGVFEQARARLCLGEALRRIRRPGAASHQLDQAYLAFEQLGAQPWADRAAAELATVGVSASPRQQPIHVRLTPQELRVALQVADGLSNREVAAKLFISHKTVEVHLGHIYAKLAVRSRAGLTKRVYSGEVHGGPG
jgi:DNA-binding CsgD family transcriptional regulator